MTEQAGVPLYPLRGTMDDAEYKRRYLNDPAFHALAKTLEAEHAAREAAEKERNGYAQLAWCLLTLAGGQARIPDSLGKAMPALPLFARYYDPATRNTVVLTDWQSPAGQEGEPT